MVTNPILDMRVLSLNLCHRSFLSAKGETIMESNPGPRVEITASNVIYKYFDFCDSQLKSKPGRLVSYGNKIIT